MPPKKFAIGQEKGYIGDKKTKYKPKEYIESEFMCTYRKHRDICYYIQHGGDNLWTDTEIENIRGIYFKTLF